MAGIGGHWCLLIVALYYGRSCVSHTPPNPCLKPVVPNDTMLAELHSNVSLTCARCEGPVSWRRGRIPQELEVIESGHLVSVTYEDEDRYTCYKDGAPLCSVELIVKDQNQDNETLRCFHRHPTHNITCEWRPRKLLHPSSSITLIRVRLLKESFFPCIYNSALQTVSCSVLYSEGDSEKHSFSLCVRGRTDIFQTMFVETNVKDLLHVGPPTNVRVTPVQNHPRKLRVNWSRPEFWDNNFYHLRYQVQYQVEETLYPSNVSTPDTNLVIDDAVMGRKHLIRVKATEEYQQNWGSWSEWAVGTPWSVVTDPVPHEYNTPTYVEDEDPGDEDTESGKDLRLHPRFPWIAPCICLVVVLLFFFGIWMRYQEIKIVKLKWGVVRSLFRSSTKVNATQPPASDSLLMSPSSVAIAVPPSLDGE